MSDSATPCTTALQASLSVIYSNSCPLSQWCQPTISSCRPLLLLPSMFSSIRVFSNESVLCIRWPKYWSFSFSISPSNEYLGLISFRIDWLDLLAIQETFRSLLQHHSSKASIVRCSAFFIVQLSHPYITTRKTISSVQFSRSVMSDSATPWIAAHQASLSIPESTQTQTIALTKQTFGGKVMSLLFSMLSGFVIAFLPRSKHLLISWLQRPSAVIFGAQK